MEAVIYSIENKDIDRLASLLSSGQHDLNVTIERKLPLMFAVVRDCKVIVSMLLSYGADPNTSCQYYACVGYPLVMSIIQQNIEITRLLIDHGADPNKYALEDYIPIFRAIKNKNFELVSLLLGAGAKFDNLQDFDGDTPLLCSMKYGNPAITSLIVEAGADVVSSFLLLINTDYIPPGLIDSFVKDFKVDVNVTDQFGRTVLYKSTTRSNVPNYIIPELVRNGADVNSGGALCGKPCSAICFPSREKNVLYILAVSGCVEQVTLLLQCGASCDHFDIPDSLLRHKSFETIRQWQEIKHPIQLKRIEVQQYLQNTIHSEVLKHNLLPYVD